MLRATCHVGSRKGQSTVNKGEGCKAVYALAPVICPSRVISCFHIKRICLRFGGCMWPILRAVIPVSVVVATVLV